MSSRSSDIKVFPGDSSKKFLLQQRTLYLDEDPLEVELPPYTIQGTDGNDTAGVDVREWHSVTVLHTMQWYTDPTLTGVDLVITPWRYYQPVTPAVFPQAGGGAEAIPPAGVWVADDVATVTIDPQTTGLTQQKVFSTLNADKMFFQIKTVTKAGEEEAGDGNVPDWIRQAIFGVTPRQADGYCPSVVGAAGGGGGGSATLEEPVDVNTIQLAGNPIDLGAGNVGAGTQLVTIATDDANLSTINTSTATTAVNTGNIVTSVQIMDDWDAVHDAVAGTDGVRNMGYATASQAIAVSADGDDVRLALSKHGEVYDASHTYPTQSNRSEEIDPANQWYEFSTLVAVTNGTDGTYYYYIPMAGYSRLDMQAELSGGTGTITLTVEGSIQADGTAPASLTYQDVTNLAYGSASFTSTQMLVDNTQFFGAFNYVRVKIVAAATNTADWTIYIKKMWR